MEDNDDNFSCTRNGLTTAWNGILSNMEEWICCTFLPNPFGYQIWCSTISECLIYNFLYFLPQLKLIQTLSLFDTSINKLISVLNYYFNKHYRCSNTHQCWWRLHYHPADKSHHLFQWKRQVGATSHLQKPMRNRCQVFPIWRTNLQDEVWRLDIFWCPSIRLRLYFVHFT